MHYNGSPFSAVDIERHYQTKYLEQPEFMLVSPWLLRKYLIGLDRLSRRIPSLLLTTTILLRTSRRQPTLKKAKRNSSSTTNLPYAPWLRWWWLIPKRMQIITVLKSKAMTMQSPPSPSTTKKSQESLGSKALGSSPGHRPTTAA